MSIEKMNMLNLVGHKDELDKVSKLVVLSNTIHIVNGMDEIESIDSSDKASIDMDYIKSYDMQEDFTSIISAVKKIKEMCAVKITYEPEESELIFDHEVLRKTSNELKNKFSDVYDMLMDKSKKKNYLLETISHMSFFNNIETSIQEMENLNHYSFEVYKVAKEKILRLKENYENIQSVVMSIFKAPEYEIVIVFTPKILKKDNDKIFKSLNCELISIPEGCKGKPRQIVKVLKEDLLKLEEEEKSLSKILEELSNEKSKLIAIVEKSLELELKAQKIKNSIACTNEFFCLGGWVPDGSSNGINDTLGDYNEKLIMVERDSKDIKIDPPTKLKNNFVTRPFEAMVTMYGIPSYKENDPTTFLGISYMLMFGAMFGDLGQGLVFLLAGIYLKYKKYRTNLGPIVARLGISSCIFGIIYGSFFGFEDVIPALVIRPMENITETLLYAICFGSCLLIIGFIFSMMNSLKKKNMEEGLFGKNGATGFIFYLLALTFIVFKFLKIDIIPGSLWVSLFIILLLIILFKEPLANLIQNKRPLYKDGAGEYYIEGIFELIECLLSMFSNTLSFVRVGAFALNHVGLFLAFATLAKMIHNGVGGALMYVLGNLIIIGIEGLVVFIQGMRLEYYELFSKYYEGEGIAFEPVGLTNSFKFKDIKLIEKLKGLGSNKKYLGTLNQEVNVEKIKI